MNTKLVLLLTFFSLVAFTEFEKKDRLIFETEKGMRSSFCIYSDGKFYETQPSGCTGQEFLWGYWENKNDTIHLSYNNKNIFYFETIKSKGTLNKYQIFRIIDFYNQPVRFENICYDTVCTNLYNPGILKILKGNYVSYIGARFNDSLYNSESIQSNSDTITLKWNCNRESLESISGGQLYTNQYNKKEKIILGNKQIKKVEK
jgi:hypothetical protein